MLRDSWDGSPKGLSVLTGSNCHSTVYIIKLLCWFTNYALVLYKVTSWLGVNWHTLHMPLRDWETPGSPMMSTHDSLQSRWVNPWSAADGLAAGQRGLFHMRVSVYSYMNRYMYMHVYIYSIYAHLCVYDLLNTSSLSPWLAWRSSGQMFSLTAASSSRHGVTALETGSNVWLFIRSHVHWRRELPWSVWILRFAFNFRSVLGVAVTTRMYPRRARLLRHCRCLSRCSQDTWLTRLLGYFQETDSVMTSKN